MSNTAYATAVLSEIRQDRKQSAAKFAATKAIAEIGICSNIPGTYTLNILNGKIARNWDNVEFESQIAAVKCYARAMFGNGTLKKSSAGTFLVY
jgi:hypothetical protein